MKKTYRTLMENCDPTGIPYSFRDLEEVRKIYSELIETSIKRQQYHQEATDALDKAVNDTRNLILDFLEQLKLLNIPKDL